MGRKNDPMRIGLALGGGGARGLAHIGVLQVLEEHNIPVHQVVGTSIGAVAGARYALEPDANRLKQTALGYLDSPEFLEWRQHLSRVYPKKESERLLDRFSNYAKQLFMAGKAVVGNSVFEEDLLLQAISDLFDDVDIQRCRLPFAAVAVDLHRGESVSITQGSLRQALMASSSIPGLFPPVVIDGRVLVDGGAVSMVPVWETRKEGAQFVIAVDVSRDIKHSFPVNRGIEVVLRADDITNHWLTQSQLRQADVVITPAVSNFRWYEFQKAEEMVEAGSTAALQAVGQIQEGLRRLQRKQRWRRWNPFAVGTET